MKLKQAERSAIFAGETRALRRPEKQKPSVEAGDKIVLSWSRGGSPFLERDEDKRRKAAAAGRQLVASVPRRPSLWIVLKEPRLKEIDGKMTWIVEFDVHDFREPTRLLGPPPSPPREAGLKTRWGQVVGVDGTARPKKIPKRGEALEHFTPETERGYGSGGRGAVDDREGVDDATLSDYARRLAQENEMRRNRKQDMADKLREERQMVSEFRKGRKSGANAAKRRAERAAKRFGEAA